MIKQIGLLFVLLAYMHAAPAPGIFKELPCLNKLAGQRLPHPENPHQFLRCVTADSAWIETCPDNLFYNPHSQICDWDQIEKITTTTTTLASDLARIRPVLVKFLPVSGGSSDIDRAVGVSTAIIENEAEEQVSTPRPNTLLTTAALEIISVSTTTMASTLTSAPQIIIESTSPIAHLSESSSPADIEIISDMKTTEHAEFDEVVESTTPSALEVIAAVSPAALREIVATSAPANVTTATPFNSFNEPVEEIAVSQAPIDVIQATTVAAVVTPATSKNSVEKAISEQPSDDEETIAQEDPQVVQKTEPVVASDDDLTASKKLVPPVKVSVPEKQVV